MKPFNEANQKIIMLLVQDYCIMPIDMDNIRTEMWSYSSSYPLQIVSLNEQNHYSFNINLYQWHGKIQCLKLIRLQFKSATNAEIVYVNNTRFDKSTNHLGENLVKNEKFILEIKPLILEGFRAISLKDLLDSK